MSIGEIVHTASSPRSDTEISALDTALDEILLTGTLSERSYAWAVANAHRAINATTTDTTNNAKLATVLEVIPKRG